MTAQHPPVRLRSGPGAALIAATVLASMAGFLDATVVNVAVPAIGRDLGTSLVALQWILTGYLLTAAALLLVAGALADRYGRRRVLIIGLLVMLAASVVCAVAPSFSVLIAARVLQGVGAALVVPSSLSLLNGRCARRTGHVACLAALLPTERRVRAPMLKLSLFASRQFSAINAATVLLYGAQAAAGYLLVLRCELTLGYSAAQAGAVLIPSSVIFLALSPISGALVRRVGARWLMTVGMVIYALGLLWLSQVRPGSYAQSILPGVILWGVALGVLVTPLTAAVLAAVGDADLGEASAISDVAARLGGAVLIALVPALIGVHAGRGLAQALAQGYTPAMIVLAGLSLAAAAITVVFVREHRADAPRFGLPMPYHGCPLPDPGPQHARVPAAAPPGPRHTSPG